MNCPSCGKPVDSLRAPAVGVRDGKVVSFCSKECAAQESKPVAMPRAQTSPAVAAKISRRTPAKGVPQKMSDLDSGPVIEILHEPASGVVASSADARVSSGAVASRSSQTDGAIQIADTGHIDDYVDPDEPGRGRGARVFLILLLLIVAGGAAAYYFGYLDKLLGRDGAAATRPATLPVQPKVEAAAPPDAMPTMAPADALAQARDVLTNQLKSESPRVRRLAAMAFSRTGDKHAIDLLAAMLDKETSEITRLDIAYALARAGDKRGTDHLVGALGSPRRDVKGEAAQRLALLGDPRAAATLDEFLEYSQFRLSAAEQLAYLSDPRALDVLDKTRADPKASADDQARAVIALANGGRADVASAVRGLLPDTRFNAFAALALANLHDSAARPVLVKQLAIPSLRVGAARALRRLEPGLDPGPLLPPLAAAIASSKDTEQVQAAEAILLLAGDVSWSARQ
jgi:HEAT repeat protein